MSKNIQSKLHLLLGTATHRAEVLRQQILNSPIPPSERRNRDYHTNIVEALTFSSDSDIEGRLGKCLYLTLCDSGKNASVQEDVLYIVHPKDKPDACWQCVFGDSLLNTDISFPSAQDILEYWEWHINCFASGLRVPFLEKEHLGHLRLMFLDQTLGRAYARADLLYAPISTWREVVEWHLPKFRDGFIAKKRQALELIKRRRMFHLRSGAPFFIIKSFNEEIARQAAIIEAMKS